MNGEQADLESPFLLTPPSDASRVPFEDGLMSDSEDTANMSVTSESPPPSKDVLTRLDSLVSGNGDETEGGPSVSDIFAKITRDKLKPPQPAGPQSILKKVDLEKNENKQNRRIRFPDHEEMHEVIGYGGDVDYSSDEDDDFEASFSARRNRFLDFGEKDDEMTVEEKNILNLTRKNTSYNSQAANLSVDADEKKPPVGVLQLGTEKKGSPPLVTVRPFVREHTPGKVHVVSPMRNGEVVTSFSSEHHEENGRGEAMSILKDDKTNSPTSNNNEDTESNNSEESGMSDPTDVSEGETANGTSSPVFSDTLSDENETSLSDRTTNHDDKMNSDGETSLSTLSDDGDVYNDGSLTTSGDEDLKCEKNKLVEEEEVHHQQGKDFLSAKQAATARLSFLHSTIQFEEGGKHEEISKTDESQCQNQNSDENIDSKPKVKITRKSPYVVGPYASTAILKGTPKPSVNIRKPPIPKEKPRVPLKPEKFLPKVGPVAAPRKGSFRSDSSQGDVYANVSNEVTISDESHIQVCQANQADSVIMPFAAECYVANSDVQNALIIDVSASGALDSNVVTISSSSFHTDTITTSVSQNQKDLSAKNREALEAIRKSLNSKLAEGRPPPVDVKPLEPNPQPDAKALEDVVIEEGKEISETNTHATSVPPKKTIEKTISNTSSNFELNRATIASVLEFNRHDRVARPSTKRQAPKPPPVSADASDANAAPDPPEEHLDKEIVDLDEAPTKELPPEPIPTPPPAPPMPKSALSTSTAGRHSSMKSTDAPSPKSREVKNRVQFSPETTTVTLPPTEDRSLLPISYNRWMSRSPGDIIESSFTGQPISVPRPPLAPGVPPGMPNAHPKRPVPVTYAPMPQVDDEVRRWTEKKNKQRSKSLPRGSEIDEIIGSSKNTKTSSKLFLNTSSSSVTSSNPVRRQSRVELFEAERKQLQHQLQQHQRKGKFSLKKFFKIGLSHNPYGIQFSAGNDPGKPPVPPSTTASSASVAHPFLDKEHEREILERERNRLRPEIIHPLDLQNAGVEVVKITPRSHVFEKNQRSSNLTKSGVSKSLASAKGKVDYVDSKDSGHETSSIHTENSEGSNCSSSSAVGSSVQTSSPTFQKSSSIKDELEFGDLSAERLKSPVNVNGCRSKPVPPPRSHSLETFGKKGSDGDHDGDHDGDDGEVEDESGNTNSHEENISHNDQNLGNSTPKNSHRPLSFQSFEKEPHPSMSSNSSDGLPPHDAYIQPGKMKIGTTSVPALNTMHHLQSFSQSPSKLNMSRTESLHSSGHSDSFSFPRGLSVLQKMVDVNEYCGSEGDSERESISPPRIIAHDEHQDEDDHSGPEQSRPTSGRDGERGRHGLSRLSIRKGRSVVHKNLEDNYGAVISANHEALAQILEQASHRRPGVIKSLRAFTVSNDLALNQFNPGSANSHEINRVDTSAGTFFSAYHSSSKTSVTLLLNAYNAFTKKNQNSFSLFPAAAFEDKADIEAFIGAKPESETKKTNVFVTIFQRMQVETLSSYSARLSTTTKINSQAWEKEVSFVLLQLINALKFLQAQGIEEVAPTLQHFVLVREERDPHYRVVIIIDNDKVVASNDENVKMSLSCTALAAMLLLFHCDDPVGKAQLWAGAAASTDRAAIKPALPELTPSVGMFRTMAELLQKGSSIALDQVKSMLEYMLWGPSDITMSQSREQGLQRWLDLERATVLNNLIRTQGLWNIELTIFEEYHLLFLVQTCAKMLLEASLLFDSEVACM